jgi:hypothetical protein
MLSPSSHESSKRDDSPAPRRMLFRWGWRAGRVVRSAFAANSGAWVRARHGAWLNCSRLHAASARRGDAVHRASRGIDSAPRSNVEATMT